MKERKRPFISELKQKTEKCLSNRKNANCLVDILVHLQADDPLLITASIQCVNKIFSHFLDIEEMCTAKKSTESTNEDKYKSWLLERYKETISRLLELLEEEDQNIKEIAFTTLMRFVNKEGKHPLSSVSESCTLPVAFFKRVLTSFLSTTVSNQSMSSKLQEYLVYDDVRYHTLKHLQSTLKPGEEKVPVSQPYLENVHTLLDNMCMPSHKDLDKPLSNFMSNVKVNSPEILLTQCTNFWIFPCTLLDNMCLHLHKDLDKPLTNFMSNVKGKPVGICDANEHRKKFSSCWVKFLHFKLSPDLYRKVLIYLHDKVIPYMTNPLLLSDFLTVSYNIGGAMSLLSLNGLFILIHKHNLEYPDFFKKLYAMFEPTIFHAKYRSRFFYLSNLFLTSTHLPAYLVAAFAKRLARICLTAPVVALKVAIPFIYNLINRHPVCKQLIHRPNQDDDKELKDDPYLPNEPDPAKCRAIDSCLWELKTLQEHYYPEVVYLARKIDSNLPEQETDLRELLDGTADEIFEKESSKKIRKAPVTFEPPKGLFEGKEDRLKLCWTF